MTRSLLLATSQASQKQLHGALPGIIGAFGVLLPVGNARADVGFDLDDYGGKVVLIDFWVSS